MEKEENKVVLNYSFAAKKNEQNEIMTVDVLGATFSRTIDMMRRKEISDAEFQARVKILAEAKLNAGDTLSHNLRAHFIDQLNLYHSGEGTPQKMAAAAAASSVSTPKGMN